MKMVRQAIFLRPVFQALARLLRRIVRYIDPFGRTSYAQEGEDIVLERFFTGQQAGFYVDVGAHHPLRFSNTYLFYLRGWRGVNIDAMPGSMEVFRRLRPRDINVESAVAGKEGQFTYYVFREKALNTCDSTLAEQYVEAGHAIISRLQMKACPLVDLLSEYVPEGTSIDFLSVDVEGFDLDVLRSNDWQVFRPKVVITEELRSPAGAEDSSVRDFLISMGYRVFARTFNSVFYVANEEAV
ncbi:MAG: FkbM family methyltransferase [Gallionella sp.]|nr:FkbM family methyltransferase [Gallionella sp.]MDD4947123.1 FkbM family methyltransferase [Gallionella sp.]MDD5611465.1 FkbM family methyltransferase [Gallionella sp.]